MMKTRWAIRAGAALVAVVYGPLLWLWATVSIVPPDVAKPADAALIFGALVRSETISPLHAERLDAGVDLYRRGVVPVLVVSNAPLASQIMADYLERQGVPREAIELDGLALATPDTCVAEAARAAPRQVILVSQAYHLPRIALQCRKLGVVGQYVSALREDASVDQADLWTKLRVRATRHTREALLIWAELLGQYRWLEQAVSP